MSQRAKILVLDDESDIRSMLSVVVRRMGHEPVLTASGREAIARWEAAAGAGEPYDLLMLDVRVPGGIGGQEVLAHVRNTAPEAKAVLITGTSREEETQVPDEGSTIWLSKPFTLKALSQTIEEMLDG